MYAGCSPDLGENQDQQGEVFDSASGKNLPLPRPTIPAGEEFVNQACTVTATADKKTRVIYLVTTKTPSQGLTPESYQTHIFSFDPSSKTPVLVKPWPAEIAIPQFTTPNGAVVRTIEPTTGGFLAIGGLYSPIVVASFDAATLDLKAKLDAPTDRLTGDLSYNFDGWVHQFKDPGGTMNGHITALDGSEVGLFSNVGTVIPVDHGFLLTHSDSKNDDGSPPEPGVFYFDMRGGSLTGPIAPWLDSRPSRLGKINELNNDSWGDLVVLNGRTFGSGNNDYVTVFDTAARKAAFSLDNEQVNSLDVRTAYVAQNYLYMSKEPDNPVVDYNTSKTVSSGWKIRPEVKLPDGWVVVQPGGDLTNDQPDPYLARGKNGDYDGPWF